MKSKCPQCQADALFYFHTKDWNQKINDAVFDYYKCQNCQLIFINPIPENLAAYYETGYLPYKIPDSLKQLDELAKKLGWRVDLIRQYKTTGKMLEIGPSHGAFSHAAQQSGFQVDAIEMDESCCRFINSQTKVRAIHSGDVIAAMKSLQTQYEVIALWHNLEHLVAPWTVLRQCASQLVPGGIIIISTPNPDSIQFRFFRKYWMHLDAPRHVTLIPRSLLTSFMEKLGMELAYFTTTDPDGVVFNKMSWYQSVFHIFGISNKQIFLRRIISNAASLLMSPIERVAQFGTTYTVIYRKQ